MTTENAPRLHLWSEIRGPLVTLVVLLLLEAFAQLAIRIPNPPAIYLTVVVYAAFSGGLRPGLISALLTIAYAIYFFSNPGALFQYTPDNAMRVMILAVTTPIMSLMVGVLKQRLENRALLLETLNRKLEMLADTDALTQLKNRRAFAEHIEQEIHRVRRFHRPTSVLLLDVDNFKSYNDSFGHNAGDELLKMMAKILQDNVRATDCVARYGGEEFVIVLPRSDHERSIMSAERFRTIIEETVWPKRPVTASFGIMTLTPQWLLSKRGTTAVDAIAEADRALYYSKEHGRNRVTHIDELIPSKNKNALAAAMRAYPGPTLLQKGRDLEMTHEKRDERHSLEGAKPAIHRLHQR